MKGFVKDEGDEGTLVEQVVRYLTALIDRRQLAPGAKLPSIRQFADANGVSKSTVVEAYDRLVARRLITSRSKSGFYVLARPSVLDIAKSEPPLEREVDEFWMLRNSLQSSPEALRPGCGWLPPTYLNTEGIRRALGSIRKEGGHSLVDYGHPAGFRALREQLLHYLDARSIAARLEQVLLTDNGSQALDLAIRFLVRPGDTVFLDDPCYFNFQASLRAHRVHVVGIPLTREGPDITAFARAAEQHRPRLYITNSVLQNPTGVTFSAACAHQILLLAQRFDFSIIEDDTFADFEETPSPRLSSLDGLQRTIYIGSFSKTLSGAIRCGYMAVPMEWVEPLLDLKLATTYGNNELSARIVYKLLMDGSYRKHVESIRSKLRRVLPLVKKRIAECGLRLWQTPEGGPFLWVQASGGETAEIAKAGIREGILLAPGNVFSVTNTAGTFLRFNVAHSQNPKVFEFLKQRLKV